MNLSPKIIEEIKKWNGFEDFNGKDIEVTSKDPKIFSDCEITLLMKAIEEDNVEIVKALCEAGVNVNRIAKGTEQVPLTCFEEESKNSFEISKILIDSGANVNYYRKIEDFIFEEMEIFNSPLTEACTLGNYNQIKYLIESGADVNFSITTNGTTALCSVNSESKDYLKILELLISKGANVNVDFGQPLIIAVESSNLDAIGLLLNAGAETNISSKSKIGNGKTAIMTLLDGFCENFTEREEQELFETLFESTNNINEQDTEGRTILFYAIDTTIGGEEYNINCFSIILSHKNIDVNIVDNNGNNVLISLLLYIEDYVDFDDEDFDIDYKRLIKRLSQKGIDISHQNNKGLSAYKISKNLGNKEIIKLLRNDFSAIDDIIDNVEQEEKAEHSFEEITNTAKETSQNGYKVSFLTRLIKPKEIILLLEELNKVDLEFNNEHFYIVKDVIKKAISKNSKSLIQEIQNGNSENFLVYNMLRIFSGNLFETGKYPYRTFFGDGYDSGYYLLSFFDKSLDKLVELDKMEEKTAHEQKKIVRENMNYLISKQLPFL